MAEWIFFAVNAQPSFMTRALALRLAERDDVVIVGRAVSVIRSLGDLSTLGWRARQRREASNLCQYTPMHLPGRFPLLGAQIAAAGRRRLAREVDSVLPRRTVPRIACYDSPHQYRIVGLFKEDRSVYLAIDDRTVTVWGAPIAGEVEAERKLLERVDHVVCVSETLAAILRERAGSRTDLRIDVLTNGYDERLFDPRRDWPEPHELSQVPRPRVLVAGHVSERIDWDGIRAVAELRPAWSWIFVGPADPGMAQRIEELCRQGRRCAFIFLPVPHERMPAWIAHCDACAVPYRLNPFTRASSPLKAIEYLALGARVLSTEIPSLREYGAAIAWVCEGQGESYAGALDECQKTDTPAQRTIRQAAVRADSWSRKAAHFRELVGR